MNSPFDDLASFCERFANVDLHCLVVGSVAAMHFGEPRATIDIGLVLAAEPESAGRIASAFNDERYYVPPLTVIERELRRSGGAFNIVDTTTGLKADCYTPGKDELGRYQFSHAIAGLLGNTPVSFAPPAAIIAMKLKYHAMSGQDKHLRDIRSMLATSPELIDMEFLERWTGDQGLTQVWQQCKNRVGEE